ncbi:hypothetical protein PBI_ACHEBE_35 [Mycobacterium phage Achebe]|nr:hypothetical protein WILE_36 [Mycobacterium phage Wile]APD17435.1 hypothetical protein PBI_ACHEBE_35 [Mycobacterium phage Achebe]ASZ73669.1 hypothetical protein SEA_MORPHER26_36 [Mycobacterium phage Morpher26]AZS11648.1 hypothetical protein SEA_CICI_36 [Mycobacterium phage Cici]QAY05366.1 hypothetical protein SEA_KATALIE136_36 [Mycobacterium phage Katalie136]QAY06995.1 hypothetical protein SEA_DATWAY_36 [Mycobacterium phage Datway]QFP95703.1 hypothetical protein SEA_ABBYSRANGER_36 [Mycobac
MAKHRLSEARTPVFLYGGRPDRSGAIWVRWNDGRLEPIK